MHGLRNAVQRVDRDKDGFDDDWTRAASESLSAEESRGASNEHPDKLLSAAWNYVTLYHRGEPQGEPTPTAGS